MVKLWLKLLFLRNDEWVDAVVQEYDAATLDELCLQIGETLLGFGWIEHIDGVKVDSFFGVVSEGWHKVLSIGDIPTPQAKLRIVQDDGAAEPTGSGQKRGIDAVDGGAEIEPADDGTAKPTGKRLKTGATQKAQSKCVHDRRKNECKECGGASVCEHGRQKHQCNECKEVLGTTRINRMNGKQNAEKGRA